MNHWSNYWAESKALNSFAESDASTGYSGPIKKYWLDFFSTLKKDSKIVDIGCGNGALACLAVEFSNLHNLNFEVHGIDAADINPIETLKHDKKMLKFLSQVHFHAKTPAENLPFKPNSIDVFISQFGFEYSNISKTVAECHKVLTSKGSINIMAHHPKSLISDDTKAGLYVFNEVLHKSPLFLQVDLLLDIAFQVFNSGQYQSWHNNPYNQSISKTIKWVIETLKEQFKEEKYSIWIQDIINRIVSILQNVSTANPQHLRQHLAQQFSALEQHRIRLDDQLNATFTDKKLKALKDIANKFELTLQSTTFDVEQMPFAWSIQIR